MNPEPRLVPAARRPHRVVVLTGGDVMHRNTCATLIREGVNVVGIVVCRRDGLMGRMRLLRRWVVRDGLLPTLDQLLARVEYRRRRGARDARVRSALVDDAANRALIDASTALRVETDSYSRADTLAAIRALDPDILVVHSPFIVGRSVRALAPIGVIGGHPGITPYFRGVNSAFWALVRGRPEMVGWTVFMIDDGIDTGPIVAQGALPPAPDDSHMTLTWKGMIAEAAAQAAAIRQLDGGTPVPLRSVGDVPPDSYFFAPTRHAMREYFRLRPAR